MHVLMSPNGKRNLLIICLIGLALVIALRFKLPEKFSQDNIQLPDIIGKGPLSYVREKGYAHHLTKLNIDSLSTEEILLTMHSYLDNTDILCGRRFRMGNILGGGYEICDDPDVRPQEPCIIYSFGIMNDFTFDDDVSKMYGCHVYSFDPSMTNVKDQYDRSSNVHFYKIGIDGKTYVNENKWSMHTFRDIRTKLGHQNSTIKVVKIDAESSEWDAIPEMFESGELSTISQLLMEFHVMGSDRDYLLPRLKAIQAIERSGLKKFYAHKHADCKTEVKDFPVVRTKCYEVNYLRR